MKTNSADMLVSVVDRVVCVKIRGRASFTLSVDFKTLVSEMRQRGYGQFIIDLSECLIMDSTFLGVLAGIGMKLADTSTGQNSATMELLNPNERVADLLDTLGVAHLFRVVKGPNPSDLKFQAVEQTECTKLDLTRNCLEAHEVLMGINPENVARFKDVTDFFKQDLK